MSTVVAFVVISVLAAVLLAVTPMWWRGRLPDRLSMVSPNLLRCTLTNALSMLLLALAGWCALGYRHDALGAAAGFRLAAQILAVLFLVAVALGLCVLFLNRPRFLVAPPYRNEPGLSRRTGR